MNDTHTQTEHDELKDLLQSPGFMRLVAHVTSEWGSEGYARKLDAMLTTIPASPDQNKIATENLFQLKSRRDEVRRMIEWPTTRLQQLAQTKEKPGRVAGLRRA